MPEDALRRNEGVSDGKARYVNQESGVRHRKL